MATAADYLTKFRTIPLPGGMAEYLRRCEEFAGAPPQHSIEPCEGCNATKVRWIPDPKRLTARTAICYRCGVARPMDFNFGIVVQT